MDTVDKNTKERLIPLEHIANKIFWIRGKKVMMDRDLSALYGVETKVLNQAVKRNLERFPEDFMFQLTGEEAIDLRSQIVTLKRGQHRKYLPFVFTEHGVAMLSSVLKSKKAIEINIFIVRSFIRLREILSTHKDLVEKIEKIERKYDRQFKLIFDVMQRVLDDGKQPKIIIGFE
jgi:phage regulator Rha-like protein